MENQNTSYKFSLKSILCLSSKCQSEIIEELNTYEKEVVELLFHRLITELNTAATSENKIIFEQLSSLTSHLTYYAIRAGNTELLYVLFDGKPENYFTSRAEELDTLISSVYKELKILKNVQLENEMEIYIAKLLLNLRFFSDADVETGSSYAHDDIYTRIHFVSQCIDMWKMECASGEFEGIMILICRSLAQNICTLKRMLKWTYVRIPWEEMEFCLIAYISYVSNHQNMFNCLITRTELLKYLETFSVCVIKETKHINEISIEELSKLPRTRRDKVMKDIVRDYPPFGELYENYQLMRDAYSLEIITKYVTLGTTVDPTDESGQVVIIRALQVTGEHLKSSLESPKLSSSISELALLLFPYNTSNMIRNLRNSFSHGISLFKYQDSEEIDKVEFFIDVQNDLKKIISGLTTFLYRIKFKVVKVLLDKILGCNKVGEMRKKLDICRSIILRGKITLQVPAMDDLEEIELLLLELESKICDKTCLEKNLLKEITETICIEKNKFKNLQNTFKNIPLLPIESVNENSPKLKEQAKLILENLSKEVNFSKFDNIADLTMRLWELCSSRITDKIILHNILQLVGKIIWTIRFESQNVKYFERLDEKLQKMKISLTKHQKSDVDLKQNVQSEDYFVKKVKSLKNILTKHNSSNNLIVDFSSFRSDAKVQAEVEMFIFAILSILDDIKDILPDDLLFLDDNAPFLVGKNLRNHLAHGNVLNDALFDPILALYLNAQIITKVNLLQIGRKIGKQLKNKLLLFQTIIESDMQSVNCQRQLFLALSNGCLNEAQYWILKGADINGRDNNLMTTLHYAAKSANLDCLKYLISRGVSTKAKNCTNKSLLHIAAEFGRAQMIEFLINDQKMLIDDIDATGKTPLHFAALNNYIDVVKILMLYGARINSKDATDLAPVHYVVLKNHVEVVQLLLENERNVDSIETCDGFKLLHLAAQEGHVQIARYLLNRGANPNVKSIEGLTPLYLCASSGHSDMVILLILNGANVNGKNWEGEVPLDGATKNGHEHIVEILLKYDSIINEPNSQEDPSTKHATLCFAIIGGHLNIVKLLINYKANINICTAEGTTPLHFSAVSNNKDIAGILLKNKAQTNVEDKFGFTPLTCSIRYKTIEVMKLLIQNGADCNKKNNSGLTPLHIAVQFNNLEAASILITQGADVFSTDDNGNSPLHLCYYNNSLSTNILYGLSTEIDSEQENPKYEKYEILKLLVEKGAALDFKNIHGHTLLHICSFMCNNLNAEFLVSKSSNISIQDNFGYTPFHYAVEGNNLELVELFLEEDWAQFIDLQENDGKTALCIAVEHNYSPITRLLIRKGANVNISEPLYIAVFKGFQDIVEILLKVKNLMIIDQFSKHNTTITELASRNGHIHLLTYLVSKKIKNPSLIMDIQESIQNQPQSIFYASAKGHYEVVEFLLENGAETDKKCKGLSPLHIAAIQGHISIVEILLKHGANPNLLDDLNRTPIVVAVVHNQILIVKFLLNHIKFNINAYDYTGFTLLHIASQFGFLEIVKSLIKCGADKCLANSTGEKAIHIAAWEGHLNIVGYLLSCGMPTNVRGRDNWTLLHYAAQGGHIDIAKHLIQRGIDVNEKDDNGCRPLHIACFAGHFEFVVLLLEAGAYYDCVDNFERTPLTVSQDEKISLILFSIENLFRAVKQDNISDVEISLQEGAIINAKNSKNESPLHYAAWKGYQSIVEILLKNKCNPNIRGKNGCMPLHYASKFSHYKIVKALLREGAIYNSIYNRKTPIEFAVQKDIRELLKLIDDCFKEIKNNDSNLIDKLNNLISTDLLKTVLSAKNISNNTIKIEAVCNGFSDVGILTSICDNNIQ